MTILGSKLTHHRNRLGLSIQDLAVCAGMTNVNMRFLEEHGATNPNIRTLAALARALGISPLLLAAAAFDDLEVGKE